MPNGDVEQQKHQCVCVCVCVIQKHHQFVFRSMYASVCVHHHTSIPFHSTTVSVYFCIVQHLGACVEKAAKNPPLYIHTYSKNTSASKQSPFSLLSLCVSVWVNVCGCRRRKSVVRSIWNYYSSVPCPPVNISSLSLSLSLSVF